MKRTHFCVLIGLAMTLLSAVPAEAAPVRVSLYQPRMVDADTARLAGTFKGRDVVRIQRYAAGKDRWVDVRRTRTNERGRFRTTVPAAARERYYRAVAGGRASQVRTVVAPPVEPESPVEPEPEPETPVVPEPEPETPVVPEPDPTPGPGCGPQLTKSDGGYWTCTLADDFDGTELNRSIWRPQTGFKAGSPTGMPCYIDDPSVISVSGGNLHLSVRAIPEPIACPGLNVQPTAHVAGMVSTYRLFSQQYGRFEARIKNTATTMPGLQEAFWLWPDDRYNTALWPAAGEIDIAETYSQHPNHAIPFLHYTWFDNWGPVPGLNTAWNCLAQRGVYNTYALEWTENRLEILVNGKTCLVNTSGDQAFMKPYIVALTQMLGVEANAYTGQAPLPATMTVDYVRVWK